MHSVYGYTDLRKVEADVEVIEDRTGDLSLRKPRTSQLSHADKNVADLGSVSGASLSLHIAVSFAVAISIHERPRKLWKASKFVLL